MIAVEDEEDKRKCRGQSDKGWEKKSFVWSGVIKKE